jgi:hypothetical protein
MRNTCQVHSDGICVYIDTKVKSAIIGKIILIVFNIVLWSFYLFFALSTHGNEVKGLFLPLVLIPIILIFILGRYTLWNLWGKELIRINTKNITFQRSYGIITTNENQISLYRLGWTYSKIRFFKGLEYGKLFFYNYDKNDIPKLVFENTILIQKIDAEIIIQNIVEIFENRFCEANNFHPFTLN